MAAKPWWKSRTLGAILATAAVLAAREVAPPSWRGALDLAEHGLVMAGLWFARLGAGSPIAMRDER